MRNIIVNTLKIAPAVSAIVISILVLSSAIKTKWITNGFLLIVISLLVHIADELGGFYKQSDTENNKD